MGQNDIKRLREFPDFPWLQHNPVSIARGKRETSSPDRWSILTSFPFFRLRCIMIPVNRQLPPYLSSQTIPDYLSEAMSLPLLRRLLDVGMHCGLEYTSYPYFSKVEPYNRF